MFGKVGKAAGMSRRSWVKDKVPKKDTKDENPLLRFPSFVSFKSFNTRF
jgi:hypothetical protein